MKEIEVKIVNHSNNPLPEYSTKDSAGMDVRAMLDEPVTLRPLERALIRGVCNDGVGHEIRDGGDTRFVTVYGKNLVAECAERLRNACAEATDADYGK